MLERQKSLILKKQQRKILQSSFCWQFLAIRFVFYIVSLRDKVILGYDLQMHGKCLIPKRKAEVFGLGCSVLRLAHQQSNSHDKQMQPSQLWHTVRGSLSPKTVTYFSMLWHTRHIPLNTVLSNVKCNSQHSGTLLYLALKSVWKHLSYPVLETVMMH